MYVPIEAQLECSTDPSWGPISAIVPSHGNTPDLLTTQHLGATSLLGGTTEVLTGFNVICNLVFLETIPINTFKNKMYCKKRPVNRATIYSGTVSGEQFNTGRPWDIMHIILGSGYRMPYRMNSFQRLGYSSSALASNFDTYQFLAQIVYLISNKMLSLETPSSIELFDILLTRLQKSVLLQFLRSDFPTARAVWEASVPFAWIMRRVDIFSFLLKIGLERPNWILGCGHMYLSMASSFGLLDIIRELLRIGVRADDDLKVNHGVLITPAIMQAVGAASMACVEALIQGCDVNRPIGQNLYEQGPISNFNRFLFAIGTNVRFWSVHNRRNHSEVQLSFDDEIHRRALDVFLEHGADVDSTWPESPGPIITAAINYERTSISTLHDRNDIPSKWRLSVLDRAYYWNNRLYERLSLYSRKEASQITRTGICVSAKRGNEFLQAYLNSRPPQHPADRRKLFELILAEQFFMDNYNIDTQLVYKLVDFGVDIKLPTMATTPTSLCSQIIETATRLGFTEDVSSLIGLLIRRGAVIDHEVVNAATTGTGLGVLPHLLGYGADMKAHGSRAMCIAARMDNLKAVSWLLEAGVDINATIPTSRGPKTILALVSVFADERLSDGSRILYTPNLKILPQLIRYGAKLKLGPCDSGNYEFLKEFLKRNCHRESFLKGLELLLDSVTCPEELATSQESLLSSWRPVEVFCPDGYHASLAAYELLLHRGCPIRRDCQLGSFIFFGGRHEIIYKLLDAGADVNASSKDTPRKFRSKLIYFERFPIQAAARRGDKELLVQLLKRGANVNQPAIGNQGRTALQGACEWRPASVGDRERKLDLIKFLIDQGSDVNAPPAKYCGMTALQIAAREGDIGTALVLLEHGANINAAPGKISGFCALDAASWLGRLDMVKLLLSMAAHSHDRGLTGYEGAIRIAVVHGHMTVADLIREHIKTFGNCIILDFGDSDWIDAASGSRQLSDTEGSDDEGSDDDGIYEGEYF
ncbi:hypothetical protein O1611_g2821 [Lasiodiplodia mahajangana]|uniref:Uncharacterized protein n=1 Tax=Lasiodiplodia mahajangana TaxID=1108764 RepID=A0ACC2JUE4_9PEZI|nr:hypothetical protein O1611_g2821 [Lasiodiplodia mahajangana]